MKKIIFSFVCILFFVISGFSQRKDTRELDFQYKYYYLEGERQKALENHQLALTYYQQAKNIYPQNPSPYYVIALLLVNNDPFAATEYASKAVKLDKNKNLFYIKTLLSCQILTNKIDDAIKSYKFLIKADPKNLTYYSDLTAIYENKKDYKNAIKTLNDAEKKFGINEIFSMAKESYYYKLNDKKKAIAEIKKLLESEPNNNKYKAIMGESYLINSDSINAEKYFSEIENAENIDANICLSVANYYQTKNNSKKYFEFLEKAFSDGNISIEIKQSILFKCIESVEFSKIYKNEIKILLDKTLLDYPDNVSFRAIAADYYINIADYKNAQAEMEFLITKDKDKYQVWQQLITIDYYLNDFQKMYEHSKDAVALFPNYLDLYKPYVTAAYATKHYSELIEAVDYASMLTISERETLIDFLSIQGEAYNNIKKYHESDSVFELVLTKDPNNLNTLNNYSYYLSLRNEKLDRALELSSKLIELEKNNPIYLDTYAWVLYKCEKFENALSLIDKTISLDSSRAIYYNHKGDILFKLNKINEAITMWEKAKELGDNSELLNNKINSKQLID